LERDVRREHRGRPALVGIVRVGNRAGALPVLGLPLPRASGALGELPVVAKEVPQEVAGPLGRRRGPGDFEAAPDGVGALAGAKGALPPEAHLLDRGGFGIGTYVLRGAGAVRLTKGVATGDERDHLLVGHPHSGKGLADLLSRSQGIRLAVGALGVDVDEAHLSGRQGAFELAVFLTLVAEPLSLFAPVNVFFRLPHILAAAS